MKFSTQPGLVYLGILWTSAQTACVTVNIPLANKPQSWPAVYVEIDDQHWQEQQKAHDHLSFRRKNAPNNIDLDIVSVCDRELQQRPVQQLHQEALSNFAVKKTLALPDDLKQKLSKQDRVLTASHLIVEKPIAGGTSDVDLLMISKHGSECIHDIIVSGSKLDDEDIAESLDVALSLRETKKDKNQQQRFVINHVNNPTRMEGH